jgi:diguanylate cyclase (GGDEF)-like protein
VRILAKSTYLSDVWSATDFENPELSGYAEAQLRRDTRVGVQTMAALSLMMQLIVAILILSYDLGGAYLYTNVLIAVLSLHILISAAYVDDVRTLHVLGMAFLVMGALAVTFLAHRAGDLNLGMMAAITMLFIAIPLVPWALREAAIIVTLTYLLLTSSLVSVPGRFDPGALWVLQTLLFGAAVVVIVIAARNTFIRKQDMRARFELESAKRKMELLSMQDHLTGAWNRRFLEKNFETLAARCAGNGTSMRLAVLDIDDFKGINDLLGHHTGDEVLKAVARTFMRVFEDNGTFVRLGGDEFLIIYCRDDLDTRIDSAIADLQRDPITARLASKHAIGLSAGIAHTQPGELADLQSLYTSADRALYAAKQERHTGGPLGVPSMTHTARWKL